MTHDHNHPLRSLLALLDAALAQRDAALAKHKRAEDMLEAARARAQQLARYRDEYAQRWQAQFRAGSAIELVQCYQVFMQKLEQAIALQATQVLTAEQHAGATRAQFEQCELHAASVDKLLERRRRELAQSDLRSEQRASDEVAQRIALQRARVLAPQFDMRGALAP